LLDRDDWRKIKEKHGIPDAICSFSMGEKVAAWKKKDDDAKKAKDYKARVVAIDALLKDMKTYQDALKKAKPAKFKGKTPGEQTKNQQDAIGAFAHELTYGENMRAEFNRMANPMAELQAQVKAARARLANVKKDDSDALAVFYAQQLRNDVGLPVKMVARVNTDPAIHAALETYEKVADDLDQLVNHAKQKDPDKVWRGCQLALTGLAFAIGAN